MPGKQKKYINNIVKRVVSYAMENKHQEKGVYHCYFPIDHNTLNILDELVDSIVAEIETTEQKIFNSYAIGYTHGDGIVQFQISFERA